jgi:hypothetical protein
VVIAQGSRAAAAAAPAPPAAPAEPVDPYKYALPLHAPQESELWRRNVMFIYWTVLIWALIVLVAAVLGLVPGQG